MRLPLAFPPSSLFFEARCGQVPLTPLGPWSESADVLDVYLTRDASRVFVVDLNPFAPRTDPLLFSYEALLSLSLSQSAPPSSSPSSPSSSSPGATLPELRLITSESQGASTLPRYSHNRYPKDVVDLSEGQSVAEFAREWAGRVAEAAVDGGEGARGAREGTGEGEAIGR